jgi:hypothetical protein
MAGSKDWWDCFGEGAARAFWAEAYIREVEDLGDEETEFYNPEAYRELSPGAGGEWMHVIPETPKSALKQGRAFVRRNKKDASRAVWEEMDDKLGCDESGWYAAMGAMGHGVGLFDEGIDDDWVGSEEPDVGVLNDAYDAVREAVAELSGGGLGRDEWKETWDWAEDVWGPDEGYGFNRFFGRVASIYAEREDLEEVGSSDVWHISYWAVQDAKKRGVRTRRKLMETVLDLQDIWGYEKDDLMRRYG